jgi:hypothetical protein
VERVIDYAFFGRRYLRSLQAARKAIDAFVAELQAKTHIRPQP